MSDDFNRRRSEWLDRVAADPAMRDCFRLAYILSGYVNRNTGKAWPTQETLVQKSGLSVRTVRDQIKALAAAGYLVLEPGRGRHIPNTYRLNVEENRQPSAGHEREKPAAHCRITERKPAIQRQKTGSPLPTELSEELSEYITSQKVSESDTRPTEEIDADDPPSSASLFADAPPVSLAKKAARAKEATARTQAFEKFRAAYPRRPGSNWTKARESFDRALKRGVQPDEIIAGAVAYAGYNAREGNVGERARFIKLPVTWLNQSEWTADYGPVLSAPSSPSSLAEITTADWRSAVERFRHTGGEWSRARLGPPPGSPGCRVPREILSSSNQRVA